MSFTYDDETKTLTLDFEFDLTKVNSNGRRYEKQAVIDAVKEYEETAKHKYGELGTTPEPTVNLENISHEIVELNVNDEGVVSGKVQFLPFSKGVVAKTFHANEVELAVIPRGMGMMEAEGDVQVIKKYKLTCFDVIRKEDSSL